METSKMGKRGTIVLPIKLRQRFGLKEGDLLVTEEREGGILLRPAVAVPIEIYTPERKAEFLLNNAVTRENYDDACEAIREMGLDPKKIPYTKNARRESLPTNKEFDAMMVAAQKTTKGEASRKKRHA
jgi:AbrB family looped-hinge helix DNA binding protein